MLNKLFSKDGVLDMFREQADLKKGNFRSVHGTFLKFKVRKVIIEMEMARLNNLVNMKALKGTPYIHACKRKIALVKEHSTLEIE